MKHNLIQFTKIMSVVAALYCGFAAYRSSPDTIFGNSEWPRSLPFPDRLIVWLYELSVPSDFQRNLRLPTKEPISEIERMKTTPGGDIRSLRWMFGLLAIGFLSPVLVPAGFRMLLPRGVQSHKAEIAERVEDPP